MKYLFLFFTIITWVLTTSSIFAKPGSERLRNQAKGNIPFKDLPYYRTVEIKNRGGFVLRVRYFDYKDDGTCCKTVKHNITATAKGGSYYFVPEGSEIYLHAIAAGGWTKCATVSSNAHIQCARGSLNMHCYYTDGTHGHIRGIKHGGCAFPLLYFTDSSGDTVLKNITLTPGSEGNIFLKSAGATKAEKIKILYQNGKDDKTSQVLTDYFWKNSSCNQLSQVGLNELEVGKSCILHYRIPANPGKGTGDFKILSNADHLYHKPLLAVHVATPGFLVFQENGENISKRSLGSADTGSFRIKNIGEVPVNHFNLGFYDSQGKASTSLASYFSGSCLESSQIASGDTCTLNYSLPARLETGHFDVIATGSDFYGKATLSLNLSLRWHLVFTQGQDDHIVDELPVVPGSDGYFAIKNIGALPASHFHIDFLNGNNQEDYNFGDYFHVSCHSCDKLSEGKSCNLSYSIPKNAKLGLTYVVKAHGTNGDGVDSRLIIPVRRAYMSFWQPGPVVKSCNLDTDGMLVGCTIASDSNNTKKLMDSVLDIKLQRYGEKTRAYLVASNGYTQSVMLCVLDPDTGKFTECHNSGATGFSQVAGITFSPDGGRAYLGEYFPAPKKNPYIYQCEVEKSTGMLKHCHDSGARIDSSWIGLVQYVVMNPEGSRIYAIYEGLDYGYYIDVCKVNKLKGNLTKCQSAAHFKKAIHTPWNITFLKDKNKAYIPAYFRNTIDLCQMDVNGFFAKCENSGIKKVGDPNNIQMASDLGRVYATSYRNSKITTCLFDENGYLSACQKTGDNINYPYTIALYPAEKHTY